MPAGKKPSSGDRDPKSDPPTKAPRRGQMRPELDGLTETLTLRILEELDFGSLAAVKQVSRHLHRIAKDESLFRRVSVVRWSNFGYRESKLMTNCRQLGPIQMPKSRDEAVEKFLVGLEGLLAGGAALVSLQTPDWNSGGVLGRLPALLDKHRVHLKALACDTEAQSLLAMAASQPELEHLRLPGLGRDALAVLADRLPNLRHLDLDNCSAFHRRFWEVGDGRPEVLSRLLGKLRSLVYADPGELMQNDHLEILSEASGGKLLFRGVGTADLWDLRHFRVYRNPTDFVAKTSTMYFAVEDFRQEERGYHFFADRDKARWGRLSDAWVDLDRRIPQPTLDEDRIIDFLDRIVDDVAPRRSWADDEDGDQDSSAQEEEGN